MAFFNMWAGKSITPENQTKLQKSITKITPRIAKLSRRNECLSDPLLRNLQHHYRIIAKYGNKSQQTAIQLLFYNVIETRYKVIFKKPLSLHSLKEDISLHPKNKNSENLQVIHGLLIDFTERCSLSR